MKTALELNSEKVSPELSADFVSFFSGCDQKDVPPFMKHFLGRAAKICSVF